VIKLIGLNKIYNMDCLEGMEKIEDESVDLLLTDPPYNVSMKSNFHTMGRKGVDFGDWDKGFNQEKWLYMALDKVRKGGSVVIFNDWKNIGILRQILEEKGFILKELIQWKKTNPMPRNRDRLYVTSCEFAIWAVNGKGWTFNRQRDTYENTIFEYPLVSHKQRIHPTQKREELISDILRIHSNEGNLILDPFMGSGTTAKCCIELNRNYIGFELDKNYYDSSIDRLNKVS
jgi:site-specific DNA-methyltransferase (adenine-specific)